MKDELQPLIEQITQWGRDRQIIQNGTMEGQWLKLVSEIGEMADHMAKGESIADDIGDCFVVLVMMCGIRAVEWSAVESVMDYDKNNLLSMEDLLDAAIDIHTEQEHFRHSAAYMADTLFSISNRHSLDFIECIEIAYDTIKDRKGTLMPNGVFVKEEWA